MSGTDKVLDQIRSLHPYRPGKPVEELERELGIKDAIKMASNENPLGCSPKAVQAIQDNLSKLALYPDANAFYLKQALAEKLAVDPGQITVGNGSNDVLDIIGGCYLDQGREAIYSQYGFLVYALVTQSCGASHCVTEALPRDHQQPYGHDLQAMLNAITDQTSVIFIANPNNPTGTRLAADALRSFIEQVPANIIVVIDEAYFEYVDEADHANCIDWLPDFPNLIVTRTFSKIYGLAGLRLGYSVSSLEIADFLNRVRQPFNGNSLALAAATASLQDDEFVKQSAEINRQGMARLQSWCDQKGLFYIPSAGNFLTIEFPGRSAQINDDLMKQGIIVRPVDNYKLDDFLRISIGTEDEINSLIEALDNML